MVNVTVTTAGTSGPRGNGWIAGTGTPSDAVGFPGDYFLNQTDPDAPTYYGPKTTGNSWTGTGPYSFGSGGGGGVVAVTATDTSIVVSGTDTNPTIATGTLDVIAAQHPPAASWSNNSQKITNLENGSVSSDAAAFGQIPVGATSGALGTVQLTTDLGGTATAPTVVATNLSAPLPTAQGGTGSGSLSGAGLLLAANNLSDVALASTARTNLGLGVAAVAGAATTGAEGIVQLAGDFAGTATSPTVVSTHLASPLSLSQGGTGAASLSAAGIVQTGNNLSDLTSASSARTNLGLGTAATAGAATSGAEGIIQLAGDLNGGSASSPQVTSTHLSAALPVLQGGTGQTTVGAAYNAFAPTTTLGDIAYANGAGTNTRLPGTTSATKQYLQQTGTGTVSAAPAWGTIAAADLPAATTSAEGVVQLAGDVGGSATSVSVLKINGIPVTGSPTANQVIQASSTTTAAWASLTPGGIGALARSSNLSDVSSAATSRTNLGLTAVATASVGLSTDMVAAGTPAAGATGRWADAGHAHPSPSWVPSDNNLIWSTVNPLQAGTTCTLSSTNAGVLTLQRVLLRDAITLTNIYFGVSGVDNTSPVFTNCYLGLYDSTGTRQAVTADISSVINVALVHQVAWTSTYAAPAGEYFIALVLNGTWTSGTASTTWNLKATGGGATSNTGLAAPHLYLSNMLTLQTTLPSTITLSSQASNLISAGWGSQWYGLS